MRLSGPPFQTHYFSGNLVEPEIEPGPLGIYSQDHWITEAVKKKFDIN
jgi:osmotically-inducible protein OsmY